MYLGRLQNQRILRGYTKECEMQVGQSMPPAAQRRELGHFGQPLQANAASYAWPRWKGISACDAAAVAPKARSSELWY